MGAGQVPFSGWLCGAALLATSCAVGVAGPHLPVPTEVPVADEVTPQPREPQLRPVAEITGEVIATPPKHGTWVYQLGGRALADVDGGVEQLLHFAGRNGLNEVYLSNGAAPPESPKTPAVLRALKQRGLRVEALLDNPSVQTAVERILTYNQAQPLEARFDGIHYDYEPWIGTGADERWVPELLVVYQTARDMVKNTGLTLAADISAAKLASLSPANQFALLEAASLLVLMAYEVPETMVQRRGDQWLRERPEAPGTLMLATRVRDFGADRCVHGRVLADLERRFAGAPHYAGWATFSYNEHLDPTLCPGECCTIH